MPETQSMTLDEVNKYEKRYGLETLMKRRGSFNIGLGYTVGTYLFMRDFLYRGASDTVRSRHKRAVERSFRFALAVAQNNKPKLLRR